MKKPPPSPEECANCGAAIPRGAKACPECGADERTGWRENADSIYDGLDLPEAAFDDGKSEGSPPARTRRVNGISWYWWVVGILLLLSFLTWALGLR